VVKAQIEEVVYNLTEEEYKNLVIAYEPVWAIGTGKTASAEQAQEIHAYIRQVLAAKFGAAAQDTAILYGGSCKPSNAPELFAKEDVDGGLIGGAALKAEASQNKPTPTHRTNPRNVACSGDFFKLSLKTIGPHEAGRGT
jgi:triosephosphate isomerase